MNSSSDSQLTDQPTDLYAFLHLFKRYRLFILLTTLLATIVAGVIVFRMPNIYTASVSAVPPRKSSSSLDAAMSSVSSTLREFGLTKIAGKKGDSYDFIVLLQSRQIQDSVIKHFNLAKAYDIPDSLQQRVRDELNDRTSFNLEIEGNYVIGVDDENPQRAADIANFIIQEVNSLSARLDKSETEVLYNQFDSKIKATDRQIAELRDSISTYGRSHKIFSPVDQAKAAATGLADIKANKMKQEVVLSIIEHSYGPNDPLTIQQKQTVEELAKKENEIETGPGFMGNSTLNDAAGNALPYIRMSSELEALVKLKAFLLPSFEQVKLDLTKVAPSLYVIDDAVAPQKKSRPKRSLILGGAMLGAFTLSIIIVLALLQIQRVRKGYRSFLETSKTDSSSL